MTYNTILDMLRRQPFEPFAVQLSSGDVFEIRHPEMAWLTRTNLLVGMPPDADGIPESHRTCALLHIASASPIREAREG